MEKEYPMSMLDFEQWFRSEEACREYVARLRWPSGFRCPRCGHDKAWRTTRRLWDCRRCGADTSVITGTIFQDSKMPLRVWFRAMWWVTSQKTGVSALGLQRVLGLGSYRTAWVCLHKLRRAMVRPGRELLSGRVEVDEIIIGGRQKGRGGRSLVGKSLVAVAAEVRGEGVGRIRLHKIPDASEKSLTGFIRRTISPGSTVITDGWPGYTGLDGFVHLPAALSGRGQEAPSSVMPHVHRVASLLKRWLMGTHQGRVSSEQLDFYLDEFVFRFNRRLSASRGMLFYRLMQQAVAIETVPVRRLISHSIGIT